MLEKANILESSNQNIKLIPYCLISWDIKLLLLVQHDQTVLIGQDSTSEQIREKEEDMEKILAQYFELKPDKIWLENRNGWLV